MFNSLIPHSLPAKVLGASSALLLASSVQAKTYDVLVSEGCTNTLAQAAFIADQYTPNNNKATMLSNSTTNAYTWVAWQVKALSPEWEFDIFNFHNNRCNYNINPIYTIKW